MLKKYIKTTFIVAFTFIFISGFSVFASWPDAPAGASNVAGWLGEFFDIDASENETLVLKGGIKLSESAEDKEGALRYNKTDKEVEVYDGGQWKKMSNKINGIAVTTMLPSSFDPMASSSHSAQDCLDIGGTFAAYSGKYYCVMPKNQPCSAGWSQIGRYWYPNNNFQTDSHGCSGGCANSGAFVASSFQGSIESDNSIRDYWGNVTVPALQGNKIQCSYNPRWGWGCCHNHCNCGGTCWGGVNARFWVDEFSAYCF